MELENIKKFIKDREQDLEQLRNKKKALQVEVTQLKAETTIGFKKRIKELGDAINKISECLATREGELWALEMDYGYLHRQMETHPSKPTEVFEDRKVAQQPLSMERTIKEKETTEKLVFQTNQPNRNFQCPIKLREVNIDQECKNCRHVRLCQPEYLSSLHSSNVDVNE
jgi:predicted nuclease with TOPRIM domain